VDGDVLTCQMHGWKWNLTNGKCLTSVGHDIRSAPAGEPVEPVAAVVHADSHDHHEDGDAPTDRLLAPSEPAAFVAIDRGQRGHGL